MNLAGMSGGSDSESVSSASLSEFERLLGESIDKVRPGRIVKGVVTEVSPEVVTVDIGFKSDGIVPVEQFKDLEGQLKVSPGDPVEVMLLSAENESGQVVISKERADQFKRWKEIEDALEKDLIITGKVLSKVKGGLQVDVGIPAFLPGSQIDIRPQRNLDKYLNQLMEFKVLKVSRDKGNIVLSRRAVLTSERDQLRNETLKVLSEGVVMEGTVKNITDYGAFIDLGGIDGLLHITDISWGRVNHPSERISVGQKVPVVVLKYDNDQQRVSLGMKQLKEDPWITVAERYPAGARIKGRISNLTDYGAFVTLEEGVDGFIHVSDLTWSKKTRHPSKVVTQGQEVDVVILNVDIAQQKIGLGLKQTLVNPWEEFARSHSKGTRVSGKVRTIAEFGIFIGVTDGIDGLVHVSDFSWTKRVKDPKEIQELFKKGDTVEAVVLDVDVEGERLSLGIKQLEADPWETISSRYPLGSIVKGKLTSVADFGVFVELEQGVEGLVHISQLGVEKGVDPKTLFSIGTPIECEVTNIDNQERRISLSLKSIQRRKEKEQMAEFMEDSSAPVTFGDLIRAQMEDKK